MQDMTKLNSHIEELQMFYDILLNLIKLCPYIFEKLKDNGSGFALLWNSPFLSSERLSMYFYREIITAFGHGKTQKQEKQLLNQDLDCCSWQ